MQRIKPMAKEIPTVNYLSHKMALNLDRNPAKESDRMPAYIMYIGVLCALILMMLGGYDLYASRQPISDTLPDLAPSTYHSWMPAWLFDAVVILVGIGMAVKFVGGYLQYRKIIWDGANFCITNRRPDGKKIITKEPVNKYCGVLLRIEFFQLGFLTRNRYIIEALHKSENKCVPLYISMSAKNIRKQWKYYAKKLNLPALLFTNEGIVTRNTEDLDKSIISLNTEGKVTSGYDFNKPLPKSIILVRKSNKKVLKSAKIFWDAYNLIMWAALIALLGGAIALWCAQICLGAIICGTAAVIGAVLLCRKDKIVIKKYKFVIVHKFPLKNRKKAEVNKLEVEDIEVMQNPATGRFYLAIYSNDKSLIFGKKMPPEDLLWVKDYLIYDLIKQKPVG